MSMFKLLTIGIFLTLAMAVEKISFYGLEITPQAPITKFENTLVIPAVTPDQDPKSVFGLRAMWPGLEPEPVTCLLQNVLSNLNLPDEMTVQNAWYFFPYWCCDPAKDLVKSRVRLFPGDLLQNTYQWNPESKDWFQNWLVQPGKLGSTKGVVPFGGGLIVDGHFDKTYSNAQWPPLVKAIFSIELQEEGKWDFGKVEWRNIIIEAQTKDTDWCTGIPAEKDDFIMQRSSPVATVNENTGSTTCYIAYINFVSLNEGA